MAHGRPPVEKTRPEDRKPERAAFRAPLPPKASAPAVPHKPGTVAFAQGLSVGQRADALPRGPGQWRVFLYPTGEAPKAFDVAGSSAEEATSNAWKALQAKRDEAARRNGGR